jgi:hypothetical protein
MDARSVAKDPHQYLPQREEEIASMTDAEDTIQTSGQACHRHR